MKCVNPRRLPNPNATGVYDSHILCACGKCYACLSNRRRSWLFRLQYESLNSVITLFTTLTYSDDNCDGLVHKDHLQKFFKRLRHYEDFSYYAIGEYGTHTHRPHYHVVFFFKSSPTDFPLDSLSRLIDYNWNYGLTSVSRASYRRLNYILHYHTRPKEVDGRKTFALYSKGLGMDFITSDMVQYLLNSNSSIIHDYNGHVYVLPRYYRKKISNMIVAGDELRIFSSKPFLSDSKDADKEFYKNFHKHLYQVSEFQILTDIQDRIAKDANKLLKYNNQDKLI